MKRREAVATLLVGIAMGLVDAVPGVSGGTIAFITGRYQRLTAAIAAVDIGFLRALGSGDIDAITRADIPFLIVLFGGLGLGAITMARIVEIALRVAPVGVNGFFFGIIAGAAVVIGIDLQRTAAVGGALGIGVIVAGAIGGLSLAGSQSSLVIIFGAGALAASALLLPGVSGSFVLFLLGQYEFIVTDTIGRLPEHVAAILSGNGSLEPFVTLGVFGLGGLAGAGTIARLATYLLRQYREVTLGLLTGLMIGSLRVPVSMVIGGSGNVTLAIIAAVVGFGAAVVLSYAGSS